ncbi:hypothetical protein QQG55_55180 [Brugia pahangi]
MLNLVNILMCQKSRIESRGSPLCSTIVVSSDTDDIDSDSKQISFVQVSFPCEETICLEVKITMVNSGKQNWSHKQMSISDHLLHVKGVLHLLRVRSSVKKFIPSWKFYMRLVQRSIQAHYYC